MFRFAFKFIFYMHNVVYYNNIQAKKYVYIYRNIIQTHINYLLCFIDETLTRRLISNNKNKDGTLIKWS